MSEREAEKSAGLPPSDESLLMSYCAGRVGAFEQLLERYRQELFNFLARFLGDRVAAEDVFQETFIQVHLSAGSFDTTRRFKPWLFTIAANKGRDYLRRRARRPASEMNAPVVGGLDRAQTFVDLMQIDTLGPGQRLVESETQERVREAVRQLPDHLREILLLAYFQQLSYADVALMLEIPLGTVKSRLHAAVGAFAKSWKEQNPGDATT